MSCLSVHEKTKDLETCRVYSSDSRKTRMRGVAKVGSQGVSSRWQCLHCQVDQGDPGLCQYVCLWQTRQHIDTHFSCVRLYTQLCAPQIRCIICPTVRQYVDHHKGPLFMGILTCLSESLGVCESWRQSESWRPSGGYDCHENGSKWNHGSTCWW